ncbi:MAG: glycerol-3-phosphate 1-O-acyltransferase PlsY [Nitrospinaceae bacterium]
MALNISIWVITYLMGSIPFGVLFARAQKINLQEHGSRNIGATNVSRILGKKAGIFTLLGDTFKGWLAILLAYLFLTDPYDIAVAGFTAFLGHLFSVFIKFKGGKGVAIGLGIHLYIMPIPTLMAIGVFALTLWVLNYVSLSSICSSIVLPIFGILTNVPAPYIFMSLGIAIMVVFKHRGNIFRILMGTESNFQKK